MRVRTQQLVVMQGPYDWDTLSPGLEDDGRTDMVEHVLQVDDIGSEPLQEQPELPPRLSGIEHPAQDADPCGQTLATIELLEVDVTDEQVLIGIP